MNILILAQYFPPDMGGSSTRAYNISKGLVTLGNTVNVISSFPHYPEGNIPLKYKGRAFTFEEIDGIKITRVWIPSLPHDSLINRTILHSFFMFFSLLAIPLQSNIDVIFAVNPNLFVFFPALIYSLIKRKPIVRNVDDLWPEVFYDMKLVKGKSLKKVLNFLAWLSYHVPVAIVTISLGYKDKIIRQYKVNKNKIEFIEVGVDMSIYSKINILKKEDFIVMYSGILGRAYDFKNVLMAAKILSNYNKIKFIIRGIGECEQQINDMITYFKLNNVVLNNTFISKRELVQILNYADIFLHPLKDIWTAREGLQTKLFEYQALGKPIICCSTGEPARYIQKTKSGVVVPPGDYKALANAILELYKDENIRNELGLNGLIYVSSQVSCEAIGKKISLLFQKVIQTRKKNTFTKFK